MQGFPPKPCGLLSPTADLWIAIAQRLLSASKSALECLKSAMQRLKKCSAVPKKSCQFPAFAGKGNRHSAFGCRKTAAKQSPFGRNPHSSDAGA
jgi:hypothetical protein